MTLPVCDHAKFLINKELCKSQQTCLKMKIKMYVSTTDKTNRAQIWRLCLSTLHMSSFWWWWSCLVSLAQLHTFIEQLSSNLDRKRIDCGQPKEIIQKLWNTQSWWVTLELRFGLSMLHVPVFGQNNKPQEKKFQSDLSIAQTMQKKWTLTNSCGSAVFVYARLWGQIRIITEFSTFSFHKILFSRM